MLRHENLLEATRNVRVVNHRQQLFIWAAYKITVGFAHVYIDQRFVLGRRHPCCGALYRNAGLNVR
jgi:hypothetical protein